MCSLDMDSDMTSPVLFRPPRPAMERNVARGKPTTSTPDSWSKIRWDLLSDLQMLCNSNCPLNNVLYSIGYATHAYILHVCTVSREHTLQCYSICSLVNFAINFPPFASAYIVDGNLGTNYLSDDSGSHTKPWILIDLVKPFVVSSVRVLPVTGPNAGWFRDFQVMFLERCFFSEEKVC